MAAKYFFRLTDPKFPTYGPMILGIQTSTGFAVDLWVVVRGNDPMSANWQMPLFQGTAGQWTPQYCNLLKGNATATGSRNLTATLVAPAPLGEYAAFAPCEFRDPLGVSRQADYLTMQNARVSVFGLI